ncbi:hypothetical protein ACFV9C_40765 [Kribbella sp. NPDC059898]|uniref:hypothetical protein n=1 Tax=Kribbella sp. NPDC059898 TaxID=3346995 RepID=UPI003662D425
MKLTRKSVVATAGIIIGAEAVAAILGLSTGWLVGLLAVLLGIAAAVFRDTATTPTHPEPPEPMVEPTPEPQLPSSRVIYDARIPSAAPEYQFSFSCTVYWTPIGQPSRHVDLAAAAVASVMRRARQALALMEPTEGVAAKQEIATALGRAESDDRQQARVWADAVQVRLPESYARQAELRADLRRRQEVNTLERQLEKDLREYLSKDALASPGSATVWWLSKNPDQIEQCVSLYQTLRRLSDAAHDRIPADLFDDRFRGDEAGRTVLFAVPERTEDPEPPARPSFAEAVEILLDGLDPAQRKLKAFELANLESAFNNHDGAETIRTNYDALPVGQERNESISGPPAAAEDTPAESRAQTLEADGVDLTSMEPPAAEPSAGQPSSTPPSNSELSGAAVLRDPRTSVPAPDSVDLPASYREEFYSPTEE